MHRLRGRTLGLVGFGRIARAVAVRGAALGLQVVAHDPHIGDELVAEQGCRATTLDLLLAGSHIVSLHAPLTEATRGMIGERELALMPPGAILVNTSRGELVDEEALAHALHTGRLAAAGLDVFAPEPPAAANPLLSLDQVVLQPHSASFSDEALAELRALAVADALRVLRGERPEAPVP
jgi:D-3-phosphoglycerate dehydrogenase